MASKAASPLELGTRRKLKCKARSKRTGEPCQRWAINGATVCPMHGGSAPQVRAKAERQLSKARDELMELLLGIARDNTSTDQFRAITWALERAGFKGGVAITVDLKPWQQVLESLAPGEDDAEPVAVALPPSAAPRAIEAGPAGRTAEAAPYGPNAEIPPARVNRRPKRPPRPPELPRYGR
jgi:hypothetical protein